MKQRLIVLAVSLCLVALIPVSTQFQTYAQDDNAESSAAQADQPEDSPSQTVTREVVEEEVESGSSDDEGLDDGGSFLPTEKINVDSSVSFPVDI